MDDIPGIDELFVCQAGSEMVVVKNHRYYKIDGRLVFVFYKAESIPNLDDFKATWDELAAVNGLPGFYFIAYADDSQKINYPSYKKCEASILSLRTEPGSIGYNAKTRWISRVVSNILSRILKTPLHRIDYSKAVDKLSGEIFKDNKIFPVITPNWDNTPRRGSGALIFHNSTPKSFKK